MRFFRRMIKAFLVIVVATASPITWASSLSINDEVFRIANMSVRPWIQSSIVVGAIKRQNVRHDELTPKQIKKLDHEWQEELSLGFGQQPIVNAMLSTPLSQFLAEKQDQSLGLISEMVVMDSKGLNVAISKPTQHYWQGDDDSWLKTYRQGINRTYISKMHRPEGSRGYQITIGYSIADPHTGKNVGAIAVSINVEKLIALSMAD